MNTLFLVIYFFNVNTHQVHDFRILSPWQGDQNTCLQQATAMGAQKPDKNGDIPIYDCAVLTKNL